MHIPRRTTFAILLLAMLPAATNAASWPERPVRFVVSGAPGGVIDIVARQVGQVAAKSLGQPMVVENRAGAAGNVGAAAVAKAAPDGYTILFTSNAPLAQNKYLYRRAMQFDAERDLTPISLIAEIPLVVVVRADSPAKNIKELVELSARKDGGLNFGSPGNGSIGHLTGMHLAGLAKEARFTHVPYPGGPPAQLALLSGQIDFVVDTIGQYDEQIKAGKVRALALTAPQRLPGRAIPTVTEAGYPALQARVWLAAVAPRGTPDAVIQRLNETINMALATPEMKQSLGAISFRPVGGPPSELASQMTESVNAVWKDIIERYNVSVN